MRKRIAVIIVCCGLFTTNVYAHIVGAFGDFLVAVNDDSPTEKLKDELKKTKKEIEDLTPQIDNMNKNYKEKESSAVENLEFYNTVGLDAYYMMVLNSGDIMDILSNQKLFEKKIQNDIDVLNSTYLSYKQLEDAKIAMKGHVEVLNMIEGNLNARKAFIEKYSLPTLDDLNNNQRLMSAITLIWQNDSSNIDEALLRDANKINKNVKKLATQEEKDAVIKLHEEKLNKGSELKYYIRTDHIYIHYKNGEADVILIATPRNNLNILDLNFEAGFINGVMIPETFLKQMKSFKIDYSKINPSSKGFEEGLENGAILIHPIESLGI